MLNFLSVFQLHLSYYLYKDIQIEGDHQSFKQPATQSANVGAAFSTALYVPHFQDWKRIRLNPLT